MTFNAADRKEIRRAEKAARQVEVQRRDFVRLMMSTPAGRAYAWDQLTRSHLFHTSFSPDPIQMAFNEGERNAGLQLFNDLMMYCPDQYILMAREANERHNGYNGSTGTEHNGSSDDGRDTEGSVADHEYDIHGHDNDAN